MAKYVVTLTLMTERHTEILVDASSIEEAEDKAEQIFLDEDPSNPLPWEEGDIEGVHYDTEEIEDDAA